MFAMDINCIQKEEVGIFVFDVLFLDLLDCVFICRDIGQPEKNL